MRFLELQSYAAGILDNSPAIQGVYITLMCFVLLGVDYFDVGNSVAVEYISLTGGDKVVIALLDNVGNRLINLGIRYYENVLVLNSLIGERPYVQRDSTSLQVLLLLSV